MGRTNVALDLRSDDVVRSVANEVLRRAGTWFPEFDGRQVRTRLVSGSPRPRCLLYRFEVTDDRCLRSLVVKVRHSVPELRMLDRLQERRPVITPQRTLPDLQSAHREYEGLQLVEQIFGGLDGQRFGVLRALAWLPEHRAIVMSYVPEPTLHSVITSQTRWGLRPLLPTSDLRAWANAGAWLRIFHAAEPALDLTPRAASLDDIVGLYGTYRDFLAEIFGEQTFLAELAAAAGERAAATLPARLPLCIGHGDYTVRNVFSSRTGRVTVFDPMPLWRVPPYEDLARFVVGFRMLSLQTLTWGVAHSRQHLDRREAVFLRAYFGDEPVPVDAVRAFQVLLLLDKWGDMMSKQVRRNLIRRKLRSARVQVSSHHYSTEARRLLTLLS